MLTNYFFLVYDHNKGKGDLFLKSHLIDSAFLVPTMASRWRPNILGSFLMNAYKYCPTLDEEEASSNENIELQEFGTQQELLRLKHEKS